MKMNSEELARYIVKNYEEAKELSKQREFFLNCIAYCEMYKGDVDLEKVQQHFLDGWFSLDCYNEEE